MFLQTKCSTKLKIIRFSDTMAAEIKEEIDINEDDKSQSFSLGEICIWDVKEDNMENIECIGKVCSSLTAY